MNHNDLLKDDAGSKLVQVFKNGRSRAIRLPKEFEFASDSAILRKQPDGSILIMPAKTAGLLDYLRSAEPWTGDGFLENDNDLAPLDEVDLR